MDDLIRDATNKRGGAAILKPRFSRKKKKKKMSVMLYGASNEAWHVPRGTGIVGLNRNWSSQAPRFVRAPFIASFIISDTLLDCGGFSH